MCSRASLGVTMSPQPSKRCMSCSSIRLRQAWRLGKIGGRGFMNDKWIEKSARNSLLDRGLGHS
ncbi:hypothetical protein QL093DRAFT_2175693 [Fusarium oxysporum]|nr:hypothetical protein QL093DRAFT_2175693 [Fusarium oxysporum]